MPGRSDPIMIRNPALELVGEPVQQRQGGGELVLLGGGEAVGQRAGQALVDNLVLAADGLATGAGELDADLAAVAGGGAPPDQATLLQFAQGGAHGLGTNLLGGGQHGGGGRSVG